MVKVFKPKRGKWSNPRNWDPEGVPGANDEAVIGEGHTAVVDRPVPAVRSVVLPR